MGPAVDKGQSLPLRWRDQSRHHFTNQLQLPNSPCSVLSGKEVKKGGGAQQRSKQMKWQAGNLSPPSPAGSGEAPAARRDGPRDPEAQGSLAGLSP